MGVQKDRGILGTRLGGAVHSIAVWGNHPVGWGMGTRGGTGRQRGAELGMGSGCRGGSGLE